MVSLLALAAETPAGAQSRSKNIARIYTIKVKPGERQRWEAASKRFHAWEHQHHVPDNAYIWTVISGENAGGYILGSFGHTWKTWRHARTKR